MHQEKNYPGRVSGTDIVNPDFVKLAEAYGVETARVEKTDQFAEAFDALAATGKSGVIEVITDPEDLTPRFSLSELRASAK